MNLKTAGQIGQSALQVTRNPLAWIVVLSSATYILWDWGPFTAEMGAMTVFFAFLAMIAGLANSKSVVGENPPDLYRGPLNAEERWKNFEFLRRKFQQLVTLYFVAAILMFVAILAFRENWTLITEPLNSFSNLIARVLPVVRDIPDDMSKHGFTSRIAVTQAAAAIGYCAALYGLYLTARVFIFLRHGFQRNWHWSAHITLLLIAPVLIWILLGLTILFLLSYSGIQVEVRLKELFPEFETYDTSLFFRMLYHPLVLCIGMGAIWGGAIFSAMNSCAAIARAIKTRISKKQT